MQFTTVVATLFAAAAVSALPGGDMSDNGVHSLFKRTNFKCNEYQSEDCSGAASYKHERPSIFCADIDATTHSVYVNPASKSGVVFWSGPACGGTRGRVVSPGEGNGMCIKTNADEHSMGFL